MTLWSIRHAWLALLSTSVVIGFVCGGETAFQWSGDAIRELASKTDVLLGGSPVEADLLSWSTRLNNTSEQSDEIKYPETTTTRLLVGVKSAVIQGFPSRQLIRQTWAAPDLLPRDAHVVFLGCEPDWTAFDTAEEASHWKEAVRREKSTYNDLLTHELGCTDSYFRLVDKVKGFFRWTASQRSLQDVVFVMLVDDDVYVRVDTLVAALLGGESVVPRTRFYGGQVVEAQVNTRLPMNRNESQKDFVPYDVFPLQFKPAFATGAHYLLSTDLVHFLAKNDEFLHGVGTLEDVSVGLWLLSLLQIRPIYLIEFDNVRYTLCHNTLLAYGDLTRVAMRRMAANLRANRSFCNGFSFPEANKVAFEAVLPSIRGASSTRDEASLLYHWVLERDSLARTLHILTSITSPDTNASSSFSFVPTGVCFATVCADLVNHIALVVPKASIASDFCYTYRTLLLKLLHQTMAESAASSHLYALTLSNLHHGSSSPAIVVRLLRHACYWRPLIESLLARSFPDATIFIKHSEETASGKAYVPPDLIFATADDVDDPTEWEANDFSHIPRLVVLSARSTPLQLPPPWLKPLHRIIAVSTVRDEIQYSTSHIFLPSESLSFIDRRNHSPRALLEPSRHPDDERVDAIACFSCLLTKELRANGLTGIEEPPPRESWRSSAFPLDAEVENLQRFRFAAVHDDSTSGATFESHQIVSAFLAGSIPIYYGHSSSVSWLFNPKAFINCWLFASVSECVAHVADVHASPGLYDAMRREPPVVNHTAFIEFFAWHPDAQRDGSQQTLTDASHRLKELILNT